MPLPPRPAEGAQLRELHATFLGRFFENEASGSSDLRQSFLWLIAALATPGFFLPLYHTEIRWYEITLKHGLEALRAYALFDKALYLNLTLVLITLLAAIVWHALLIDRRDGLILSSLPLRLRTIVLGKLGALFAFIGVLSVGMHLVAALLYGVFLGAMDSWGAVAQSIAAHFIAGCALNFFVFAAVAAIQSTCLAVAGPRRFARASSPLQMLVITSAMVSLVLIPVTSAAAVPTLSGTGGEPVAWIRFVPAVWFVGLYEIIAGTSHAIMYELAGISALALGGAVGLLAITYPIAVRRVMSDAVQGTGTARAPLLRRLSARLTTWISVESPVRAMAQFALATFGRVHQQRLVLSIGLGAGLVMAVTAALASVSPATGLPRPRPVVSLAAVPLYFTFAAAIAVRVAIAVPSEVTARWLFHVAPSPPFAGRRAIRRLLGLGAILLPIAAILPVWWTFWGPAVALGFAIQDVVVAAIVVDLVMWGFADVPCARPIATDRANVPATFPVLVLGLWALGYLWPSIQIGMYILRVPAFIPLAVLLVIWWAVRAGANYTAMVHATVGDDDSLLLLDLTPPPVAPARVRPTPASHP